LANKVVYTSIALLT